MKLLTKEIEDRFRTVGSQEDKGRDAIVIVKFFTPDSDWTWYAIEYDSESRLFFGYVCGFEKEWGYFSLDEMESTKGPLGLAIERDLGFAEKTLAEIKDYEGV